MRGIDRQVLARDASAALVAAACKEQRDLWNRYEDEHAAAVTKEQARKVAGPLLEVCAPCPIIQACRRWAEVDQYPGIAAGAARMSRATSRPISRTHAEPRRDWPARRPRKRLR